MEIYKRFMDLHKWSREIHNSIAVIHNMEIHNYGGLSTLALHKSEQQDENRESDH